MTIRLTERGKNFVNRMLPESRIKNSMRSILYMCKAAKLIAQHSSSKTFRTDKTIEFISKNRQDKYAFSFSEAVAHSTLYSSIYAAATLSLFGKLSGLLAKERQDWAHYIQSYQCADGLFRDPAMANEVAETEEGSGWPHLTCHAIIALTALGFTTKGEFKVLEPFYEAGFATSWLNARQWKTRLGWVGNEILNYGTLLQYARDFHHDERAANALAEIYQWLDKSQDPETGLWCPPFNTRYLLSVGVQNAYHIWLLYFYDEKTIQYMERCVDSCLATQNKLGGFGVQPNSSACEDIDSIDPLVRFYHITDYRHDEVKKALTKAYKWLLVNMNKDGGFVFRRGEPLTYGHRLMSSKADESAMFPTWFRMLSLAYLSKVVDAPQLKEPNWCFVHCPGYQFFGEMRNKRA